MKTFAIHTLGCKVNTYESDLMAESLRAAGFSERADTEAVDIYIVNTCTVTAVADKKSRQMLRRARRLNPSALIVAAGCYVDDAARSEALKELLDEGVIDLAVLNRDKQDIAALILKNLSRDDTYVNEDAPVFCAPPIGISSLSGHTRAFIKIQDGCSMFCSYCVIPYVRGEIVLRPADEVLSEIRRLAARGTREAVLTGIHVSSMGDKLIELIEKADNTDGIKRVRLSSLEPGFITEKRVQRLRACDKLCPHFHLSLQSGSDRVLKAMNRRYTRKEYLDAVKLLRKYYEHPAITTDVIAGFPGESEEDFKDTLDFVREIGFYEVHVFKYSRRPGTPAADMPGQLSEKVKSGRVRRLIELSGSLSEEFKRYYIGRTIQFLPEEIILLNGETFETGYSPEYVRVARRTDTLHRDELIQGEISGITKDAGILIMG